MKIVFIGYLYQPGYHSPAQWIDLIRPLHEVMASLAVDCSVVYAGQINYTGNYEQDGVRYRFLRSAKKQSRFPFYLHSVVRKENPDLVVVAGFHFPLQVLQLRRCVGKKTVILARHHADRPPGGIKKTLLLLADRCIDGYLFSSLGNASEWFDAGIIRRQDKVYEVLAGSSRFSGTNKKESRAQTGMTGEFNFIWVGNLDANKDPMTVLDAFEKYSHLNTAARLYMIFQGGNLLEEVKRKIREGGLEEKVILVGKVEHAQLEYWYSSAEYFISGSHREGGSYALTEAMVCGCIPIVTRIPAAMKVIEEGKAGYHFSPGDANELFAVLSSLNKEKQTGMSEKVAIHFNNNFSPMAIAKKIQLICQGIKNKVDP